VHADEGQTLARRHVLGLLGAGALCAGGLAGSPAGAEVALDIRILQTASSLEALAEVAWGQISAEALARFAGEAGRRHGDNKRAFQGQTSALGGRVQDAPNPKFQPLLAGAEPMTAAATIEKVLVDSYIANLAALQDRRAKELVGAAMATAAQLLGVLRVAGAILATGSPQLLAVPSPLADLAKLPSTAGTVAPPEALHSVSGPDLIADPATGALG
jgi:hypothetical protein